jgi:hypothetical protein
MTSKFVKYMSIAAIIIMIGSVFAYSISQMYDNKAQNESTSDYYQSYEIPENITADQLYIQFAMLNETEQNWAMVYMNATYNNIELDPTQYPVPSDKAGYFYLLYISYLEQQYEAYLASINATDNGTYINYVGNST